MNKFLIRSASRMTQRSIQKLFVHRYLYGKKNFVIFVNILFNYCKYCNVQIPLATAKKKSINHSYRANLYVNNNLCK